MRAGVFDADATPKQKITITRLCMALKISDPVEQKPMSKGVAGQLIRRLLWELKVSKEGGDKIGNKSRNPKTS